MVGLDVVIAEFKSFVETNPPAFVAVFITSVLANFIEIGTYVAQRRRNKEESAERARLTQLVATYESVLTLAKETVGDQKKLEELKKEVRDQTEMAQDLVKKGEAMRLAAQRDIVNRNIEYQLSILRSAHDEVLRLRTAHANIGAQQPDIPSNISKEVAEIAGGAREYSRDFILNAGSIILFLLILPWPVDALLLPLLLERLIVVFFMSMEYAPAGELKNFVTKRYSFVVFICSVAVWSGFAAGFLNFLGQMGGDGLDGWWSFRSLIQLILIPVVLALSARSWFSIRKSLPEAVPGIGLEPQASPPKTGVAPSQGSQATSASDASQPPDPTKTGKKPLEDSGGRGKGTGGAPN